MPFFFYKELSLHNIILEDDALQVVKVKAVSFNIHNWSKYSQLVDDTRKMLNSLFSLQIHHISRIANKVAHGLAQAAIRQFIDQFWME
jgi:hypothetical protein